MSFKGFTGGNSAKDETLNKPSQPSVSLVPGGVASRNEVYIGKGSKLLGSLIFSGSAELDCQVEGEIEAPERLIIGEAALVHAKIRGGDITIKGTVQGDIVATKRLTLKRPAKVAGNIAAPLLVIEEGVLFEGKCSMAAASEEQRQNLTKSVLSLKPGGEKVA